MSLHEDLLVHAEKLLTLDRTRPRQANLRRAVSAAYYALFRLLIQEAVTHSIGRDGGAASRTLRVDRARWFGCAGGLKPSKCHAES
mgnify:CR=1 FL=1